MGFYEEMKWFFQMQITAIVLGLLLIIPFIGVYALSAIMGMMDMETRRELWKRKNWKK